MQNNARKNIIYSIILLMLVFIVYYYRQNQVFSVTNGGIPESDRITVTGQTMGTSYRVVYLDGDKRDFKSGIDSILNVFNQSLSTYIPDSEISQFNQNDSLQFKLPYFSPLLEKSREVFESTEGAFDPTVGPLVNHWGFGPDGAEKQDSTAIKDLLQLVGFELIRFDDKSVRKEKAGIYLDFSAIAKGYGVDVITEYLQSKGIRNMLVEIGGELVAKGTNEKGELWKVGVSRPEEGGHTNELIGIIALENKGLATSGNYRNFYVREGRKFSHTISPFTGMPVQHGLLSATVIAPDCMTADAYATAMMVIGTEKAIELQEKIPNIEVFLVFSDESGTVQTFTSESLIPYMSILEEKNN